MQRIETLQEFYDVMHKTIPIRKDAVQMILNEETLQPELVDHLKDTLESLTSIEEQNDQRLLQLDSEKTISLDLDYEINELEKDLFYLQHPEEEFYDLLSKLHAAFPQQLASGIQFLKDVPIHNMISDRDGTVNNYCGRYASSVQSIYNAVFLSRFAKACKNHAVILTSAPLDKIGLVDISVSPEDAFICAGSKGREYFHANQQRRQFPIEEIKQKKISLFNQELSSMLDNEKYKKFTLIGSGLQFKFGQTTIARQDISGSIPDEESTAFLAQIEALVADIDPKKEYFRIEDTGKDIEIILTVTSDHPEARLKDFDKGNGVQFLNDDVPLKLQEGNTLICGDTSSDIPMIPVSQHLSKDTYTIFVSEDDQLKDKVSSVSTKPFFVDTPDILIAILNEYAKTFAGP
ncbi:MAG: trehalose 6-phosphate synthase [Candidatus Omnitrophica bacterium]|nr:trehalose 6-phosphate synthase [Candidatus Omnitrophota bacterium]